MSEVAAQCSCSATAWCSLVCACPGGGGARAAVPSNATVWSACDLHGCDHVALSPGDNRLVCRAAPAAAAAQVPSCGARARALPSDAAALRVAGASNLDDEAAASSPFALGHTYSDGVELLWLQRRQPTWCVRAATRDGALVPLPSAAAGGGEVRGCLASPAAAAAADAPASPAAAPSEWLPRCVVGGLVAGGAYTVRLQEGCEAGGAVLFETAALVAGPLGAQCASASDQQALWSADYSKAVSECGHGCWGKAKCSTACLAKRGLSDGCAGCWGDVIGCGAWNCWSVCMGGQSQTCKDCGRQHCADPFGQCIGANVPLPDARR